MNYETHRTPEGSSHSSERDRTRKLFTIDFILDHLTHTNHESILNHNDEQDGSVDIVKKERRRQFYKRRQDVQEIVTSAARVNFPMTDFRGYQNVPSYYNGKFGIRSVFLH